MKQPDVKAMIKVWEEVVKRHFDDYANPSSGNIKKHDKLYARAQMVLSALRHYQLERGE